MKQKVNNMLNIIMGSSVGVWIGYGGYAYWHYRTHPDLYAMQSAPWYTSSLVYGAAALAILVICFLIKLLLRNRMGEGERR